MEESPTDYSGYTNAQLKLMLDERGISYPSNATKSVLIDLLTGGE